MTRIVRNDTKAIQCLQVLHSAFVSAGLADKIAVEFIHTPAYSPDFNLAEYEIHLLRLQKLHHLPSNVTIAEIEQKLKDVKILMDLEQISRTLEHIFVLVYLSLNVYFLSRKGVATVSIYESRSLVWR